MLTRTRIASALVVWWLPQPAVIWWVYRHGLERGAYPVDADSISIPIGMFIAVWGLRTPFVAWLVWWVGTRGSRGRVSWLAFDREHPIWCAIWSVLLIVAAFDQLHLVWLSLADQFIVDIGFGLLGAVLLVAARAALCTSRAPAPESTPRAAPVS